MCALVGRAGSCQRVVCVCLLRSVCLFAVCLCVVFARARRTFGSSAHHTLCAVVDDGGSLRADRESPTPLSCFSLLCVRCVWVVVVVLLCVGVWCVLYLFVVCVIHSVCVCRVCG